jgi:cyclopropane fatty-acyl-phospholipid synthase-like methyltransferase
VLPYLEVSLDARSYAPATARNREPILAVMRRVFPPTAKVLEVASGTGEHAVFMARAMPGVDWQPSDPDVEARASIVAWIAHEGLANVSPPLDLDVRELEWNVEGSEHASRTAFDAIVAINMIHISPWRATQGLFAGAAHLLRRGGIVYLYGPYKRGGKHTAPSNEAFEQWLKARDPSYGVRDLADVEAVANGNGFHLKEIIEMPANNLSVIFTR